MSKIEAIKKYIDIIKILAPERFHIKYGGAEEKIKKQLVQQNSDTSVYYNTKNLDEKFDKVALER
jgi:hypothetical protein